MPKRLADAGDDGDHEAVTASTLPILKKQRAVCKTWLEFIAALEALVGKYSDTNACTETFAEEVRTQVLRQLNTAETAVAEASWAAGDSVTACGRKVGNRAVVRAACCVLLSDMTTIATSSAGQAKLWAAFPGGPDELLAALGPDAEEQLPDGYSRMRAAINSCGRQDDRIKRIHRVLLADQASSMERLKEMDYTEAASVLRAIKGFGPKLTACVLSFTCDHAVLAVDTNVAKAVKKLGWVQPSTSDAAIHDALNGKGGEGGLVPRKLHGYAGNLRAALHGLLLNLGQRLEKPEGRAFVASWRGVVMVE